MWDASNIPNLTGKVAVVTGGNAGIGLPTVEQLALHGAKVYVAARSEKRATEAIRSLRLKHSSLSKESLVWLPLDLSSPAGATKAAQELASKEQRLDIVVLNAGIAAEDFETTPDGLEMTFAVNHVGHFTFTYHLLPLLKTTAALPDGDVRVITVASSAEKFAPKTNTFSTLEDFNDPCSAPGKHTGMFPLFKRYGLSKNANILFAAELQRRMDEEHVDLMSISLNPGGVATSGGLSVWPWWARWIMWLIFATPEKGALTQLFAATSKEVWKSPEKYKGKFIVGPGKPEVPSARSTDMKLAKTLWDTTEKIIGVA